MLISGIYPQFGKIMKKLILLMLIAISSINAFNQEVEADDVYIRGDGQLYFDGVPFNRDTAQAIADEAAASVGFVQPNDSLTLDPDVILPEFPYTIVADSLTKKLAYYNSNGELRYFGAQADFPIINTTGSTIYPGTPLSAYGIDYSTGRGLPAIQVTACSNYDLANSFAGVAEDTMLNGEIGNIVFRSLIIYNTSGFNIRDNLWVSVDSAITNIKPLPPNYPLYVGKVVTVGTSGIVAINAEPFTGNDTEVNSDGQLNGFTVYAPGVSDTVIGGNLYVEVNNSEDTTANLTYMYAGSSYDLPTTTNTGSYGRATVQLNYGTDTSLLYQYVYIDHNGGSPQLAVSTTGYPADGIRIVEFGVRSASKHSLYGMGFAHSENNAVDGSNANGVLTKIINRVKRDGSLINKNYPPDPTVSIITSAGKDTLKVTTTSGLGYQINEQVINAMNGPYVWWNSPNGTDSIIQSLSEINYAADGTSLLTNNSRYRLNIFVVIASEGYDCYLAVNVSDGIYATDDDCVNDIGAKSVVVPPSGMTEIVARFIALPIRYTTGNGGTIVNLLGDGNYQEEINYTFGTGGTGTIAGSGATYPVDDVTFSLSDNLDPTKIMQFDASNITTGTTRVLTIPDRSDTLMTALIDDSDPNLAGDLQTNGNNIVVEAGDSLTHEVGSIKSYMTAGNNGFIFGTNNGGIDFYLRQNGVLKSSFQLSQEYAWLRGPAVQIFDATGTVFTFYNNMIRTGSDTVAFLSDVTAAGGWSSSDSAWVQEQAQDSADVAVSEHAAETATHGVSSAIVGTTDNQVLTTKTINSDNNNITNIVNADIKAAAGIVESKLSLDYPTGDLLDSIQAIGSDTLMYKEFYTGALTAGVTKQVEHGLGISEYYLNVRDTSGNNNALVALLRPSTVLDSSNYIDIQTSVSLPAPGLKVQLIGAAVNLTAFTVLDEEDQVFVASQAFNIDAGDIANLGNLSGTNTGDQDLSSYATINYADSIIIKDTILITQSNVINGDSVLLTSDADNLNDIQIILGEGTPYTHTGTDSVLIYVKNNNIADKCIYIPVDLITATTAKSITVQFGCIFDTSTEVWVKFDSGYAGGATPLTFILKR